MKARVPTAEKAFSLVEVVMALGVISFALVGMLGLLSVGFSAAKKSTHATNYAAIASQAALAIRNNTNFNTASLSAMAAPSGVPRNFYFDYSGRMQTAQNADSRYLCEVWTKTVSAAVASLSGYTVLVMTVSSPLSAAATNRTKEVVHATVPR